MTLSPSCLFCRIGRGEIPCHAVYESEHVLAFLDISPIRAGHTLVMPREHHPYYDDLPRHIATEIMTVGQRLAPILRSLFKAPRVAFMFTGNDLAHAHAHVIPMMEGTDITSTQYIAERPLTFRPAPRLPDAELQTVAASVRTRWKG